MHVQEKKIEDLKKEMKDLKIYEKDLIEKFILPSGKGGQKIQKSHLCVYLKHIPTNLEIKCHETRSREVNRYLARRKLCEEFKKKILNIKSKKEEKIKKQKKRRKRRFKQKEII